ncbi:S-layer homology domain-containing protein [Paenibacillus alkalitolerans]|uniref:S-layer homology domain-containing protein n=1 Tax=Paenibacillus alkalitolerans TaxID=2799335 RepID=UPI0018F5812A|nr:S-layer homology domain-containing protein [Paenibacillus alkalitolerans]
MNIRKIAVVGALSLFLTVGSASAFAASLEDTIGLAGEESINKLVALNVFSSGASFRPEDPLTRGELAYILNQVLMLETPSKLPQIKDVATAKGANANIAKAVGNGYISLNNGKFHANWSVTYGELSKALAYGLGFKPSWSDRKVDTFYYLERKGVLSIDTDLDAKVTREDAAVIIDNFLTAKGYFNADEGVVSGLTDTGIIINNGSANVEYKVAKNAVFFINGEGAEKTAFGPGTAVEVALNAKGEAAYINGGILGLVEGAITLSDGKVKINDTLKNVNLNAVVTPLTNSPDKTFTFTNFGLYSAAGVTFGGGVYVNEGTDEVTMLNVNMAKAEGRAFTVSGNKVTLDFSGDALDNQTFAVAEDAKIVLETDAEKTLALADLAALQTDNTLSGTIEINSDGVITAITAKAEPKKTDKAE